MGKNRLQYQLLNKSFIKRKSAPISRAASSSSKPKKRFRDFPRGKTNILQQKKLLSPPIIQETEVTLRDLTPNKKGKRVKGGGIVKPKICKTKKPRLGVNTFKNFIKSTDNKSTTSDERDFYQKLEHVKQFINEIKAETQLKHNKDNNYDQLFRTNDNERKEEESSSGPVPTLLVDLRKPLDKWDIGNNPFRQEFNSEINSAYKSMWSVLDEIK